MSDKETENVENGFDGRLLAALIVEMNIARRHVTAYPKGHPMIETSTGRVLQAIRQLLAQSKEITIVIAKESIMVEGEPLDKLNPVFRDFARLLFERGVALLTIDRDLSAEELKLFNELLAGKSEDVYARGGLGELLTASGIEHIRAEGIDYTRFHLAEKDGPAGTQPDTEVGTIWERFVSGLLEGTMNPDGTPISAESAVEPEKLARLINAEFLTTPPDKAVRYEQVVASYLREVDQEESSATNAADSLAKLGRFIKALNPQIRRLFLRSSLQSLANCRRNAEEILGKFPDEVLQEALQESGNQEAFAPPGIRALLQKLARKGGALPRPGRQGEEESVQAQEELLAKFRVIFQEEELAKIIPRDYQMTLHALLDNDRLPLPDDHEIDDLQQCLASHRIETQVTTILMELLKSPLDEWVGGVLGRNLVELCDYFLSIGDFAELITIHDKVSSRLTTAGNEVRHDVLNVFARREFTDEVLRAPLIWGKAKFEDIRMLIGRVGKPFVDPLFDRLAEEESLSLRRFYMDRLLEFGAAARDAAIQRLSDNRWYVVRNVLIILRNLNDPACVRPVQRLLKNPHPKLRNELTRTLLHYRDPEGEKLVLRDLASTDPDIRTAAIQVAGKSRSGEVFAVLAGILGKGGITGQDFELKKGVLYALAEIGNPQVLPELEKILRSRNLFRPQLLNRFKAEIVRTLDRYPAPQATRLLTMVAESGSEELGRLAREGLRNLRGREA